LYVCMVIHSYCMDVGVGIVKPICIHVCECCMLVYVCLAFGYGSYPWLTSYHLC